MYFKYRHKNLGKLSQKIGLVIGILLLIIQPYCIGVSNFNNKMFQGKYNITSTTDPISYIQYRGVSQFNYQYFYQDDFANIHPAYCINLELSGPQDFEGGYEVEVTEKIKDQKVAAILASGYPYVSINELGLLTKEEGICATQFAVWCYLSNLDMSQICPTQPQYQRVVEAIHSIYRRGLEEPYITGHGVNLIPKGEVIEDPNDSLFFSQTFQIIKNSNVKSIKICYQDKDVQIVDNLNQNVIELGNVNEFKVLIPKENVVEEKKVTFELEIQEKESAVLFGKTTIPNTQNLALMLKDMKSENIGYTFTIPYYPTEIILKKVCKEEKEKNIANVKFRIYQEDNSQLLGEFITDENGEIYINVEKQLGIFTNKKIRIEEIETPKEYILEKEPKIIDLKYGTQNMIVFENSKSKGKIKIEKISKESNAWNALPSQTKLEGAIFKIYDIDKNEIETITTNKDGIAVSSELYVGKYYIQEIVAPNHYVLDPKMHLIEITQNEEIVKYVFENSSEPYVKKELPKTGR